jgi:hypothetical protein
MKVIKLDRRYSGYGTWTHGWDFQAASGTAASPSWGSGDITLGADCTAGVTGLATIVRALDVRDHLRELQTTGRS